MAYRPDGPRGEVFDYADEYGESLRELLEAEYIRKASGDGYTYVPFD